jgi:hypothetical protein
VCEVRGCLTGCGKAAEFIHAAVRTPEFEIRFLKLLITFLEFDGGVAYAVAQDALFGFEFRRQLQLPEEEVCADEDQGNHD